MLELQNYSIPMSCLNLNYTHTNKVTAIQCHRGVQTRETPAYAYKKASSNGILQ